jgi:hypothetical protein
LTQGEPTRAWRVARRAGLVAALAGFDGRRALNALRAAPIFVGEVRRFRSLSATAGEPKPRLLQMLPALADRYEQAGSGATEYFLADLWAARRIFRAAPERHIDIGSRIDGLIAHLLTFREVQVVDIRPLTSNLRGLEFIQADATSLEGIESGSLASVSSIHALEHFGLGRYGDTLDPIGHLKGLAALGRVVAPGGDLYVGVPIGRPVVEFNAHRVLDVKTVPAALPGFEVVEFSHVVAGSLHERSDPEDAGRLIYACGLYHLRRLG